MKARLTKLEIYTKLCKRADKGINNNTTISTLVYKQYLNILLITDFLKIITLKLTTLL